MSSTDDIGDHFRALADPTRRAILTLLRAGEMNAGDIAAAFPLGKPAMSHHLATLRDAGLVSSRKVAQTIWYSLDPRGLDGVIAWARETQKREKRERRNP
jgi:DNA-binding transcriptional ArsR family regulator